MNFKAIPQKNLLIGAFIVMLFIALAPSLFFYSKFQQAQKLIANPNGATREEAKAYVSKLSRYILLPENEEPTVMTVTDVEKLKNQPFFANAQNGYKVLVYSQAKKAILFDPATYKIIEIGPLLNPTSTPVVSNPPILSPTIQTAPTEGPSPTPTKSVVYKVFLYNGTSTVGLTKTVENILKDRTLYNLVDKDNAQKKDYSKTLVIDLTGKYKSEAESLASIVGGQVSSLPAGEIKPTGSDFLIIVGEDKK